MKGVLAVAVGLVTAAACGAADQKGAALPRSRPEAQGVAPAAILAFVDEADRRADSLHSFMLVRHGHVVAECWWAPYDAHARHELYSLSKSFTSTAVGLAIAEGKLSVDDPVLKFFPQDAPSQPSNNLKAMRVHDLLRMSTGHQSEPSLAASKQPWTKTFLAHPVPFKPGTHFLYNTPATYMLSAIVQKVTGQTVLDYLRPRLFEPLGIDDPTWGMSPQGINFGGYGLSVRTEDIAKFGQLYLQKGAWHNRQLIPAVWVEAATSRQTANGSNPASDWDQGYGYQFWCSRHHAFRGDGAFGQYCLVFPEQDAVVAITSGTRDMQAVLNMVWDKLLPGLSAGPLPADDAAYQKLHARLGRLSLPTVQASTAAKSPPHISGKRFRFPANDQKVETLGLELSGDTVALVGSFAGKDDQHVECGNGDWKRGRLAWGPLREQPAAVCGGWTGDGEYTAKVCFFETPFMVTLRLTFTDGKLRVDSSQNVGFGSTRRPPLVSEPLK